MDSFLVKTAGTVEVPTGAEADFARYTMTITTKDGADYDL